MNEDRVRMKKQIFLQLLLVGWLVLFQPLKVLAAEISAEGVAVDIDVIGKNISEGSIISISDGRYGLSTIEYDPSVYGVVTDHPAVSFDDSSTTGKRPVVTFGKAKVRVATINGPIKTGDLVTTSQIPGVGQKATENGYVIGVAMESYQEKNPQKVGTIFVSLHLNFGMLSASVKQNLIASLKRGAISPFLSPANALRYVVAGLIAVLSFVGGFWFFGRVSSRGVEAIGRNPLARKFILVSVVLNVLITIAVMGLGVALAYVILVI